MSESTEKNQFEHIPTKIFSQADEACRLAAGEIKTLIEDSQKQERLAVLGLATGSTPVRLYRELVRLHREEGLSFSNVVTFNLDEYYGLTPTHPESYRQFMQDQFFDHIDIKPENTHVPDGLVSREDIFASCEAYENTITELGGIDIQILGIGRSGHIGFNEPGSDVESRTRLVTLESVTRRDAARDFLGEENVPRYAITMGIKTILEARRVILFAWGKDKAGVIAEATEGEQNDVLPASFLQRHENCSFYVDQAAASQLTRVRYPWKVGALEWTPKMTRRAVSWLGKHLNKPVLKLIDEDYSENHMSDLLVERGGAYNLNIDVFNIIQSTITGWPGGKPNADDSKRPEREKPFPKRVLVMSPEPLDDVSCMGGTLHRLHHQGNEVLVTYLTSGNLGVPDTDVQRSLDFIFDLGEEIENSISKDFAQKIQNQLKEKGDFGLDTKDIRRLKGLIRRGEARSAIRTLGLEESQITFLDLPFYETGRYRRFQLNSEDVLQMRNFLNEFKPHQIFSTGWNSDPLSVKAICFECLLQALEGLKEEEWLRDCRVWLYRGQGAEWETHEIDMAVPLSPDELTHKMQGIYQHQTQRSQSVSLGRETNDAWNVSAGINRATAEIYNALGLPEYEAIEAFKRWNL